MFNSALGEVDPPQIGAGLGELLMIGAQSHANFQHPQASRFLKAGKVQNVGFEGIAGLGLRGVARLFGIGQIKVFAAGGLVPKFADGLFRFVHAGVPAEG